MARVIDPAAAIVRDLPSFLVDPVTLSIPLLRHKVRGLLFQTSLSEASLSVWTIGQYFLFRLIFCFTKMTPADQIKSTQPCQTLGTSTVCLLGLPRLPRSVLGRRSFGTPSTFLTPLTISFVPLRFFF